MKRMTTLSPMHTNSQNKPDTHKSTHKIQGSFSSTTTMTIKTGVVAHQNPPENNDGGNNNSLDTPLDGSLLASNNRLVTGLNDRVITTTDQLVIDNHEKRPDGSETVTSASTPTTTTIHENTEGSSTNPPSDPDGSDFIILLPHVLHLILLSTTPEGVFQHGMTSIPDNLPEGLLTPDRDLLWDGIALCIQKAIKDKLIRGLLAFGVGFPASGIIFGNLLDLTRGIPDGLLAIVGLFFLFFIILPFFLKLCIFLMQANGNLFCQIPKDLGPFLRSTAGVDITYHVEGDAGPNWYVDKRKRYFKLSRYNPDIDQNNNTNVTDNTATSVPAPLWLPNREYPPKSGQVVLRLIGMGTLPLYPPALKGHTDINLFAWAHLYYTIERDTMKLRCIELVCFGLIGAFLWMLFGPILSVLGGLGAILLLSFFVTVLLVLFWRYQIVTLYDSWVQNIYHEALEKAGPAFTRSCGYGVVLETKPGMLFGTVLYVRMYPLKNNNNKGNKGNHELV